ncbi:hypothetical protein LG634_12655 [Streptomyces bambusae]|uniref:hypothetical protein n=1 Tax=Streptomyces bambusae TaxID=1550616 RepID=UPI001CFE16C8|nr:hypothetical protein [Streptomyces bambusae]MCB5165682.1 hypothetical protein [Streptomyces bambusae]
MRSGAPGGAEEAAAALPPRHTPLCVIACAGSGDPLAGALARRLGLPGHPGAAPPARRRVAGGEEYTVDTVSRDGRRHVTAIRRRHARRHGLHSVHAHTTLIDPRHGPGPLLIAYADEILTALGVEHGPGHVRVVLTPAGPVLAEAAPRLGDHVLPGYDDVCLGANQADLTALSYLAPQEFTSRWAGRTYTKLCEALVVDAAADAPGGGPAGALDPAVAGEIAALPSVYHLDTRPRPDGGGPVAYTLHASRLQLQRDRRRIRRLMAGAGAQR